ncbi:conserved hypothetical protein [Paenibacillus curdlanolyticus YK9]|uniref:Uncharacterized protein n=1 Tax=Paenibacillus curdlanolyticus YK9 TaxID=717606 RepID=E0ICX2_9BACL|nr:DUF6886 family protein [Paenibacillus curdlanolyticus]EFM09687.1 conserved hypothetical protein [Paenibacillus curdlanolyticus YK9]
MKLFHVSEESDITRFEPRLPTRTDLDPDKGLVWAINERCLPNFLTPRNCPRVTYHCNETTTEEDKRLFLSSESVRHVVAIEHKWLEMMRRTTLYLYEFDRAGFYLLDEGAGYYLSETTQFPINKIIIRDPLGALISRGVEVRMIDQLWDLADRIQQTSFHWSLCRMGFAQQR